MISRIHLSVIVFIAAISWFILLALGGVTVTVSWFRYLSPIICFLLLLLSAFDIWLWRLAFLRSWFVNRPNIRGTWRVKLESDWSDPRTGEKIEPIEAYMTIRQTYSSLNMRLMTSQSSSELLGSEIIRLSRDTFRIAAIYRSEPGILLRDTSRIHHGAFLLDLAAASIDRIKGHYWTDRGTIGSIELTDRRKTIVHDFEAATEMFNAENTPEAQA